MKKLFMLVLILLLGLVLCPKVFAGTTNFNALSVDSDSVSQLGYIAIWEQQDESDLGGGTADKADGTATESRELAGWIVIHYDPTTGYYQLAWMTTGVFNTVAGYNRAYLAGYPGLDIFYEKQAIYNPITGEIYVPIENQSPKSF